MGRISQYLNVLKTRTGYTQQQLSDITGIPAGTLPRYFTDMDDDSANFEIVRKLVVAMDGSLDELAGIAPKQLEINQEKLTVDGYIGSDVKHHHSISIVNISEETKALARNAIREVYESEAYKNTQENLRVWRVVAIAEMVLIIGVLIFDITHPNMGYIQYSVTLEPIARSLIDWITRV